MILYVPTPMEAAVLLTTPTHFRNYTVIEASLPPSFLIERAVTQESPNWLIPRLFLDEASREVVGSACFIAEPKEGKVEIGYGVAALRRGRGMATRGVELMVQEAFRSPLVEVVLASSLPANTTSKRVLMKCGFTIYGTGIDEEGPVELWSRKKTPPTNEARA